MRPAENTARTAVVENQPAAYFRLHPRENLVARHPTPLIMEDRHKPLLTTPVPTKVVDEHPFEDEEYFEQLFADIQNDEQDLILASN